MTSMQTEAAARWLHDYLCDDGDVTDCARWKAGSDPANQAPPTLVHHNRTTLHASPRLPAPQRPS